MNPHLFDVLTHPFDGPFYWERSAYTKFSKINVPCFLMSRWTAPYLHLPGAFAAYNNINAPKKLMVTIPESGVGFNRPWHENQDLLLRWYDHWLKGIDTGVMDEPPITLLVQGTGEWRHETEWPLARTRWTPWYLGVQGGLTADLPGWNERADKFTNAPGLQPGRGVPGLRYTSDPLPDRIEITGPIAMRLFASLDTSDTNWIVELIDLNAKGEANRVSVGWLKASHREIDEARSKPYQPVHPHARAIPVEPGRVISYAIEMRETSYVFNPGHRIQLLVKAQDASWEGSSYIYRISQHLSSSTQTLHTIYHTREHPSHVLLPVIPNPD
jgi:predicted acyl esterase